MAETKVNSEVILGPFDVALEEPVYFKVEPNEDGKTIKSVDMINGFVHRGMESLVKQRNFLQNIIITEKVCGLCSNNHPFTYCMAVEEIAKVKVPLRAQYLRVVADEVKRVASHLFNIGMLAHLVGDSKFMTKVLETREHLQDVKEIIWGNRMELGANTIGGVKYDLDGEQISFIYEKLSVAEHEIKKLIEYFKTNDAIKSRTQGIGVLPKDDAKNLGVVGPVARASGINNDIRKIAPYAAYGKLGFNVILKEDGDVYSRALVRLYETLESIKLVELSIENLPIGNVTLPSKPSIPAGETISRTEAPRGELMYYLKTDGGKKPQRMKWRVPTYLNWEALKVMMPNNKIEDVALIFNSIDPCISCTER